MIKCDKNYFTDFLTKQIADITSDYDTEFDGDTTLLDSNAPIQSRELVELLLIVEEHMEEKFNVEFDWTSDSAMSLTRSIFKNIGSLANHLCQLLNSK